MSEDTSSSPIAEISHEPSKFDSFLEQNQTKLIILAIVVSIIAVCALVFKGLSEMKLQDAGSQFTTAKTEAELRAAMADAPENIQAASKLLIADEQAKTDKEAAIETLKDLLATYGTSSVATDAKLRLAVLKLETGDKVGAEQDLKNITTDSQAGHTKVLAQAVLADIALSEGRLEEAEKLYSDAEAAASYAYIRQQLEKGKKYAAVTAPLVVLKKPIPAPAPSPPASIKAPVQN